MFRNTGSDHEIEITRSLSPLTVWALSLGCAVGWGAFVMPGTTFLPLAGPLGALLGLMIGAVIMLIIGVNYHYMINHFPDAGGSYAFARRALGHDHGFLCAWFLALVYISIAWANATALPLIFRNLWGDVFQFGFHYQIAGYDVYFGEAMLSLAAIFFFSFLCSRGSKLAGRVQLLCALVLVGGISIGLLAAAFRGNLAPSAIRPVFSPSKNPLIGVFNVVALAPWAFCGFESVSNAAEEYSFSPKKILKIMIAAVVIGALCYQALSLIAIASLPVGYSDWPAYIGDLDNLQGTDALPVFHAVKTLLGKPGIILFSFTLLGGVFTGILGNTFALSRLILSMARDRLTPHWMVGSDKKHIPYNYFLFFFVISLPVPFLGRSVIGWIIDINTIGASIVYLYTSIVALRIAKQEKNYLVQATGIIGILCSALFFLYFMLPNISAVTTLATESYLILVAWSILGVMLFRYLFHKDEEWRFGKSTVVWISLLFLIFFTTAMWTRQASHQTTHTVIHNLAEHHLQEYAEYGIERTDEDQLETEEFLEEQMRIAQRSLMTNSLIQMGLIAITLLILFNLYSSIMQRQKRAADELLKVKNDFLANMSHEIRTPINTILGMDEMILRESGEKDIRKYASDIQRAGKMLLSLINDVLDFSRIEAGKLELVPDEYDFALLISDMSDLIRLRAQKKGLEFRVNVDPTMPHILYGDNIRIQQVLVNLLTNAVKYTEQGSATLNVSGRKEDDDHVLISVSVEDTGIGIKQEDLDKLFDAFERIDEGRNRTIEGTGLGMNIVKQLLDLMGSSLRVESVYGEGSTFSFDVSQKVLDWTPVGDFDQIVEEAGATGEVYQVSFIAPEAKVLLVDDTEMNLLVMKGLLKNTRLQIDTAEDGKAALALTAEKEYDVLLIDHRMPVMDGIEMLKILRGLNDNPNSKKPCICLTANAVAGAKEEYMKAGFDDYMKKPVNGRRIEQMLINYLPREKVDVGHALEQEDGKAAPTDPFYHLKDSGINANEGIEYAGTKDMYVMALQFFRDTLEEKSAEIAGYYEARDWTNYITKVHGLKSSARVIGADGLSEHARLLEIAGKKEDFAFIHENHGALLEEYGTFKEILKDI